MSDKEREPVSGRKKDGLKKEKDKKDEEFDIPQLEGEMWRRDKDQQDELERKWFSLVGHEMNQFKSYEQMEPEEVINLRYVEINHQMEKKEDKNGTLYPFSLKYMNEEKEIIYFSTTEDDKKKWVDAITNAMNKEP